MREEQLNQMIEHARHVSPEFAAEMVTRLKLARGEMAKHATELAKRDDACFVFFNQQVDAYNALISYWQQSADRGAPPPAAEPAPVKPPGVYFERMARNKGY